MSYVTINAVKVPAERADEFEKRFASRAGDVGQSAGFEAFELLKPVAGTDYWLVYTRWASKEAFEAWMQSASFAHAHSARGGPVASHSELWAFDTIQSEYA
jgi:heme-degrading monooxygenase HmoA